MNGELAELVCLAAHGSAWLARTGDRGGPPELDRDNSTFQYVGNLQFRLAKDGWRRREIIAGDVATWLTQLRDRQVDRLWLVIPEAVQVGVGDGRVDERMLVGFSNAGRWSLLASTAGRGELWCASWQVGNPDASDRRIWSVAYEGQRTAGGVPPAPSVADASADLDSALRRVSDFAADQDLDSWVDWFNKALGGGLEILYHPDLLPGSYSDEARGLMSKASQAWVFGGMGSWNDVTFHDEVGSEYEAVSSALYSAVIAAIIAGTNDQLTA